MMTAEGTVTSEIIGEGWIRDSVLFIYKGW